MSRNILRMAVALAVVVGISLAAADQAEAFGCWRLRCWRLRCWGSCGSWGNWGSRGGSWGSYGCGGGQYRYDYAPGQAPQTPAPRTPEAPAPSDAGRTKGYHPTYGRMRNSATLALKVPADAKVFVNDRPTTTTGADRQYIAHDLRPGARYDYKVRAEFERDGKMVTETKTIRLGAGRSGALDFGSHATVQTADNAEAGTTLIVRLPADAKLYLAGHKTKSTGEVRKFSTTKLPNGSEWTKYAIRAVVDRDGHEQVREQTVSLKAGESREVTISFDALASSDKVAETASR